MTTKEQIIQEIEQVPEPLLEEVLEFVRFLKVRSEARSEKEHSTRARPEVWEAYLRVEEENEEVFRRLANS